MSRRAFVLACLLPALLVLFVLSLVPTVGAINLAFQNRALQFESSHYVGFANFAKLMTDRRFINALKVSAIWELVTVAGTMLVAVALALVLFETVKGRARDLVCLTLVVPLMLPRVSAGLIWRFMYSPLLGVFNYPIQLVGLPPIEFLSEPRVALWAVAAVDVWQWGLFFAVIILKLVETLPASPREAAVLDYARRFEVHRFVTLPMLRAPLTMLVFVKAVESLRSFDLIYTMTGGGPGIATETLDLYAYQAGIGVSGRISYAASMSVLLLILTILVFSLLWRRSQRWAA